MGEVKKKNVIVTGGSKGIGRGISLEYAKNGSSVIVADVDTEAGENCVKEINELGGKGLFIHTDVSLLEDVEVLFEKAKMFLGEIDVLVNNAGIAHGPQSERHFLKTDYKMWDNIMKVHLYGLYYCSQIATKIMMRQENGGSIINMSSAGATRAHRNRVAYDATKGAIEASTRALALDLAPQNIRVNAVVPGAFLVESRTAVGNEGSPEDVVPLGRLGIPEDIAKAVVFLTSSDASYITGHVLVVDGGLTAQLRPPKMDADVSMSINDIE